MSDSDNPQSGISEELIDKIITQLKELKDESGNPKYDMEYILKVSEDLKAMFLRGELKLVKNNE
jgi:hypothetical protein